MTALVETAEKVAESILDELERNGEELDETVRPQLKRAVHGLAQAQLERLSGIDASESEALVAATFASLGSAGHARLARVAVETLQRIVLEVLPKIASAALGAL